MTMTAKTMSVSTATAVVISTKQLKKCSKSNAFITIKRNKEIMKQKMEKKKKMKEKSLLHSKYTNMHKRDFHEITL